MTAHLFDTNILLWAVADSPRLSRRATHLVTDRDHGRWFSPLSIGEVAIKSAKGHPDFNIDPARLRARLLETGFVELLLSGVHAARLIDLPPVHKDPFDRLMVAQALVEGVPFVTADTLLAGYPGQIMLV